MGTAPLWANGTYTERLYGQVAADEIGRHFENNNSVPMFIYMACSTTHVAPNPGRMQAPLATVERYTSQFTHDATKVSEICLLLPQQVVSSFHRLFAAFQIYLIWGVFVINNY